MRMENLSGLVITLTLVGLVVGIGILLFTNVGVAGDRTVHVVLEDFTMGGTKGTNASLTGTNITSFTGIYNSTGSALDTSNYTVDTLNGEIYLKDNATGVCIDSTHCNATYYYSFMATPVKAQAGYLNSAISAVTTTWLTLFTTIAVLALVMSFVFGAFGRQ